MTYFCFISRIYQLINLSEAVVSLSLTPGALRPPVYSELLRPPLAKRMSNVRDFVAALARGGKDFNFIKTTTDDCYGENTLSRSQIYRIIKVVKEGKDAQDQRGHNTSKRVRTGGLVAAVAAAIAEDGRATVRELAQAHNTSFHTIHNILHDDLGLSKKSARWVPKLLSDAQKDERVRICQQLVAAVHRHSMAYLDSIVTMDETMVSLHTPETKKQSKRWVPKGQPGPIKARVHASRTKLMVIAFFDAKGLIYTNIVPKGKTVNAAYIVKTLGRFLVNLRQKRPQLAEQGFRFHWDNAPVHTAAVVKNWFAAHAIQLLEHAPYSPDLAPADFFLFTRVKELLAGTTIAADGVKQAWEGVTRTIAPEEFAAAFRRWFERSEKCVQIGGNYVEKS